MSAPLPPSDLSRHELDCVTIPAGAALHRFYSQGFDPIFFDLSRTGSLNAPDGDYGVLYVAREVTGAFAETFLRQPGRTLIDPDLLRRKAYCRLDVVTDVTLIRLAGPGLAMVGTTAEIVHGGSPCATASVWRLHNLFEPALPRQRPVLFPKAAP